MKKNFSKELIIGLTVLITLLILFFGIDYLKGINVFKAANYYYASYTDVAGLAQSAPVTVNGFKVGLVRDISYEYDNPGHVKVELSLDRKLKVPKGTEAVLVTDMLGTSSIELKMGVDPDYHSVGDYLQGVTASGLMDGISNDLMPSIASIMPKVDSLLVALTTIAADPALLSAVERLDNVMANLEATTKNVATLTAAMPSMATDARNSLANVEAITTNLTSISGDLAVATSQLKEVPLDSTLMNVYEISRELSQLTAELNSPNSSLGLLIHDPGFYHNLNAAVGSLDSLLIDVKKNPKRYISIKLL
ncbi:MAG: MlaD family protein [Bacteroidales bacterium]|nr:MlaD family protein [Bacteroidales bacterium]